MKLAKTSIIIPTLSDKVLTLQSLQKLNNVEIIIVKGLSATRARNFGAKKSTGEVLIFLDDDIRFNPTLIDRIISLVKPKTIITLNGTSRVMAIKRVDFNTLKGFDENIPYCVWEEVEFFWRARKHGFRFISLDKSSVIHLGRHSLWKKNFYQIFNSTYVYLKHGIWSCLLCLNPIWLSIRWISLIYWIPILMLKSKKI